MIISEDYHHEFRVRAKAMKGHLICKASTMPGN